MASERTFGTGRTLCDLIPSPVARIIQDVVHS